MAGQRKHGRKHGIKRPKRRHTHPNARSKKKKLNVKHTNKSNNENLKPSKEDEKVEDVSSSSESEIEEDSAYQQLVSGVTVARAIVSDSETSESDEELADVDVSQTGLPLAGKEDGVYHILDGDDDDSDDDSADDDCDEVSDEGDCGNSSTGKGTGAKTETGDGAKHSSKHSNKKSCAQLGEVVRHGISDDEDTDDGDDDVVDVDDGNEEENSFSSKYPDPFWVHFEQDLPEEVASGLTSSQTWPKKEERISSIGRCVIRKPDSVPDQFESKFPDDWTIESCHVKHKLLSQLYEVNKKCVPELDGLDRWTRLQQQMFGVINNYQDFYYPMRDLKNGEEIRLVYCLHAVNHVLKTRSRVIAHNAKIKMKKGEITEEYRDQGLTRPKVLIVVPFRDSALRIVNIISNLLMSKDQSFVTNKKRFYNEYSNKEEDQSSGKKPEDFEAMFMGNVDDHFRIGLGVSKKSLKLYTEFYSSDIIIASPLGLRTVIGAEGESERDFDFLSSIEVLIFDQTDVLLMQNWDHIGHLMSHLHQQPKEAHDVDFSRVRMWILNGWSKFYRQTLVYSSIVCPEITALFNKNCHNYAGKVTVLTPPSTGTISQVATQLPQVFQRIECQSLADLPDIRLNYFFKKIVPHHQESVMAQTLVFIPSYFDYVRVRNSFKKKEIHCEFLCEYTNDKGISRARHFFFHGNTAFMLYTERLHFYRRFRIRGIKHIVFYELPRYPHFYSELCNMLQDKKRIGKTDDMTCTVMYTRYEASRLSAIVGSERATHMLNSQKSVHMFVTGEET